MTTREGTQTALLCSRMSRRHKLAMMALVHASSEERDPEILTVDLNTQEAGIRPAIALAVGCSLEEAGTLWDDLRSCGAVMDDDGGLVALYYGHAVDKFQEPDAGPRPLADVEREVRMAELLPILDSALYDAGHLTLEVVRNLPAAASLQKEYERLMSWRAKVDPPLTRRL